LEGGNVSGDGQIAHLKRLRESSRVKFQKSTAQTPRDIKVTFIPNENPSEMAFGSIIGHS
jgi:hypothetical protein